MPKNVPKHTHTRESVLDDLRAITKGREDYVYAAQGDGGVCVNWTYDEKRKRVPSCIVGHWFAMHGYLDYVASDGDSTSATCEVQENEPLFEIDAKGKHALAAAQSAQDDGVPWGAAVKEAEEASSDCRLDDAAAWVVPSAEPLPTW